MSGAKPLFISKDGKVHRIPWPKNNIYKRIEALSNQEVLEIILYYKTKDKRPNKLVHVDFDHL